MKTLVIIPTYNERDNLPLLLVRLLSVVPDVDVLVVDDNSPDGTGAIAEDLGRADPRIRVLHRPAKDGLGGAYVAGFRHALAGGYQRIVQMDADFSHDPGDLPRLLGRLDDADVVVGSRNVPGGGVTGWSPLRHLLSRGGSVYARMLLGLPVRDATGGFKCMRRAAVEALDLDRLRSNGYVFQIEVNHICAAAGLRFVEEPIIFRDRVRGRSKMSARIAVEAAVLVLRLRLGLSPTALARPDVALPRQTS